MNYLASLGNVTLDGTTEFGRCFEWKENEKSEVCLGLEDVFGFLVCAELHTQFKIPIANLRATYKYLSQTPLHFFTVLSLVRVGYRVCLHTDLESEFNLGTDLDMQKRLRDIWEFKVSHFLLVRVDHCVRKIVAETKHHIVVADTTDYEMIAMGMIAMGWKAILPSREEQQVLNTIRREGVNRVAVILNDRKPSRIEAETTFDSEGPQTLDELVSAKPFQTISIRTQHGRIINCTSKESIQILQN